jgi:hypothetical protein
MTQLENHMVLPHPTPEQWEFDAEDLNHTLMLDAWDDFCYLNHKELDYLEKTKRFQVDSEQFNIDTLNYANYEALKDSILNRLSTFEQLYFKAEMFEYEGVDVNLGPLMYQWWVLA